MSHHVFHRGSIGGVLTFRPEIAGLSHIGFDIRQTGTTYAAEDPMASWLDYTGMGIDLVAAGDARPTFKTDRTIGDGKSCYCDGIDDAISATGLALDMSAGCHVFMLVERTAYGSNEGPISLLKTGAALTAPSVGIWYGGTTLIRWDVNRDVSADQWSTTNAQWDTADPFVGSARFQADTLPADDPVYFNGAPAATPTVGEVGDVIPPSSEIATITFGHGYSPFWDGEIYAADIYYGASMTNAEVAEIHAAYAADFPGVY